MYTFAHTCPHRDVLTSDILRSSQIKIGLYLTACLFLFLSLLRKQFLCSCTDLFTLSSDFVLLISFLVPFLPVTSCLLYSFISFPCCFFFPSVLMLFFGWCCPPGRRPSPTEMEGRGLRKPPATWKVSDLDIVVDPVLPSSPGAPSGSDGGSCEPAANDGDWPTLGNGPPTLKPLERKETSMDSASKTGTTDTPPDKVPDSGRPVGPVPASQKPPPPPYGTYPCTGVPSSVGSASPLERRRDSLPRPGPVSANPAWQRAPPPTGSSSQQIQQRITVPPSPTFQPPSPLFPPGGDRPEPPLAAAVRPFVPDKGSRPQSPRKGPPTMNSSSIYHMYLQQAAAPKAHPLNSKLALKAVYGKPVLPALSVTMGSLTPPLSFVQGAPGPGGQLGGEEGVDREGDSEGQASGPSARRPPVWTTSRGR
ncbi:hypothetical protein AGOR_G00087770 [Albula goreensis]|uniref:Uncharacterized protein n=1 Tax=Albula goreensis TaxID=1534307 RepID=A0A8T3DPH4_9TELE|nr:hypothetical protein AGOR_G00087770 [Albula goreensis]